MAKKRSGQAEFVKWFGPLLDALRHLGGSGKPREVSEKIAENLHIPDKKLEEVLSSGQNKFHNQVAWARQYLVWEGYLDSSKHGIWALTPKGEETQLNEKQAREIFLKWVDIHRKARKNKSEKEIINEQEETEPDEAQTSNKTDLLEVLQSLTPHGFEKICQRLLRESGFENVVVTGQSHDGGIDGYGTLEMNPFVSFKVLFQCKRYKGTVSRAQVGDFRNAMIGRAEKGIIMTTGTFSSDAVREANRDGAPQVELVDGEKLVEMFQKVELGLTPKIIYEVDLPFFEPYMDTGKKK
ncbi:restriction endonuclease [Sinomicrobium soli]|uniref:restriction endonuclease n=1 Tax=Sinomicrobium sp. N-1-3-6 TaxID=2219864 RepID=UPI000DCE3853|nr:restriction endonuclease [Sinomicrobium sp. N-1-3-6]RAV28050.1 restriction endonuclease [Sinomicrobium sp. N-1-3-6]